MVFRTWFSRLGISTFGAWEILGYGFQDMVFETWDLNLWGLGNFRIWFSGHGFRDLGSQPLGPGFSHQGFRVAIGHGHPLVKIK
jgi:hypothetical protein